MALRCSQPFGRVSFLFCRVDLQSTRPRIDSRARRWKTHPASLRRGADLKTFPEGDLFKRQRGGDLRAAPTVFITASGRVSWGRFFFTNESRLQVAPLSGATDPFGAYHPSFFLLLLAFDGLFTADVGRLIPRFACLLTISTSEWLRPFGGQRSWGEREIHSEYQD